MTYSLKPLFNLYHWANITQLKREVRQVLPVLIEQNKELRSHWVQAEAARAGMELELARLKELLLHHEQVVVDVEKEVLDLIVDHLHQIDEKVDSRVAALIGDMLDTGGVDTSGVQNVHTPSGVGAPKILEHVSYRTPMINQATPDLDTPLITKMWNTNIPPLSEQYDIYRLRAKGSASNPSVPRLLRPNRTEGPFDNPNNPLLGGLRTGTVRKLFKHFKKGGRPYRTSASSGTSLVPYNSGKDSNKKFWTKCLEVARKYIRSLLSVLEVFILKFFRNLTFIKVIRLLIKITLYYLVIRIVGVNLIRLYKFTRGVRMVYYTLKCDLVDAVKFVLDLKNIR